MYKYLILFSLSLIYIPSIAQFEYDWEDRNKQYEINIEDATMYTIKNVVRYDYRYEGENKDLVTYFTRHVIVKVNNDEAVEKNNRIYIPLYNTIDIVEVKARSILKDGRVINLNKSNIKELKDEKESGYKIFAIEGAEVGSEVEYFYTKKINPDYFISDFLQFDNPVQKAEYSLTSPKNLEFEFRLYNVGGKLEYLDSLEEFNVYKYTASNLPPLHEEEFSAYDASRGRIEGKLAYNSANNNSRLFTWAEASTKVYNQIYSDDKKVAKELSKFIKSLKLEGKTTKEKVAILEHNIKSNYYVDNEANISSESILFLLENKYSDNHGFVKIFANALRTLGISHEVILTSDRTQLKFDPDFDTWNFLDEYLIYINDLGEYLAPYSFENRLGEVPFQYTANYGLFIKERKIRDFLYPVGEVKYINPTSYKHNFDNLDIEISFDEGLENNTVNVKRTFRGYTSSYIKSYYHYIEEQDQISMVNSFIEYLAPEIDIKESKIVDTNFNYQNWNEPLEVKATYVTPSYFDMAGDVILFKVGEVIGEQSELYQVQKRQTNVENDYNRGYLRKIIVNIPEGYKIENLDDLEMNFSASNKDGIVYLFKSVYELKDSQIHITIDEYYDEIYWPKEDFESFRKVINAAADFNKITLIMKPGATN